MTKRSVRRFLRRLVVMLTVKRHASATIIGSGLQRTALLALEAQHQRCKRCQGSNNSSDGATMYVTASPCIECAKLIIQAGIKRVVYSEKYRLEDGLDLLKRANIEVIYINPNE